MGRRKRKRNSKGYIKLNEITWDKRAENNDEWSQPVASEIVEAAKKNIKQ